MTEGRRDAGSGEGEEGSREQEFKKEPRGKKRMSNEMAARAADIAFRPCHCFNVRSLQTHHIIIAIFE